MTDAISGKVVGTTTGTPSTSGENFGAGMGKDTFLKLLVAQLKYQNPLQPTDSQQYMAQMAQFTTVEKLADIQKSQTDLAGWQRTVAGQGMVGKEITATLASGQGEVTGKVTGLRLTDSGPRLVLENGSTVSVDEVTDVKLPTTPTPTPTPTAGTPAAATQAASTPTTGTPTASTPTTGTPTTGTPTTNTPAAPTSPPATSSTSGTGGTTGTTTGSTTGTTTGTSTGSSGTSTT